jgi:hypothetical protein
MANNIKVWNGTDWGEPTTIKVWNGTAWEEAEAGHRWDGSSWIEFWRPFNPILYDEGEFEDDWVVGYGSGNGSQSKEIDHLYLFANRTSGGQPAAERTYVTDEVVDLTGWTRLYFNASASIGSNSSIHVIASTSKTGSRLTSDAIGSASSSFARGNYWMDIESLSGNYYIRFHAYNNNTSAGVSSTFRVYGVWLDDEPI